jgi:uncharacterized membrane protein
MQENFPGETPSPSDNQKPRHLHLAIMAYIPFLCFVALFGKDADEYSRKHGRQGLLLLIAEIVAVVMLLPIGAFFWRLVLIACLVGSVAGIVNAYSGKEFRLPLIGRWADKL